MERQAGWRDRQDGETGRMETGRMERDTGMS